MRPTQCLAWLLLAILGLFSVVVYGDLPTAMSHSLSLSGQGRPTRATSAWAWSIVPLTAFLTLALVEWISARLPHKPELFNFSGKDDLLKLPREYHPPIIARMQRFLDIVNITTMLILLGAQIMIWQKALGAKSEAATVALIVGPSLLMPIMFLLLQGVNNEVDAAKRQWESRRNPRS